LLVTAILLLPFLLGGALLLRRREGWEESAALFASATALIGYLLLDASIDLLLPDAPTVGAGVKLMVFVPYLLLAFRFAPWLADQPPRSLGAWLGLSRGEVATLWIGVALSALLTLAWPFTGALGDVVASLRLVVETAAEVWPVILLIWGVTFPLCMTAYERSWLAALQSVLLYTGALAFGVLPNADWNALFNALITAPLAFLLTELRARSKGPLPLLLPALFYPLMPLLFTDPRDVQFQGIPALQHVLAHLYSWVTLLIAGPGLWLARKLRQRRQVAATERPSPRPLGAITSVVVAVILWGAWAAVYLLAGTPGFYNDGFLIIMEEQADLQPAYEIEAREERLTYVRETLIETAEETQAPIREELEARGWGYRPYYVMNMIRVDGHHWRMDDFEALPGVATVIRNPNVRPYPRSIKLPTYTETPDVVTGTQENLLAINADEVWAENVTGEGIVVGGQDTGYDWDHPALKSHYRGWDGSSASHDYNWHDVWDNAAVPFDNDNHGTHTMGTVVGDDPEPGNRVGIAPGAQWIGCRNMRRGFGNPAAYAECMEFFLAPYPHGGDPFTAGDVRYAPHLTNNSWGCPPEEGCQAETLRPAVEAMRAAGIMMVVSAGNEGPGCQTATSPPANYDAAYSVGATNNQGQIVGFSSRGPIDGLLKPDIAAPGYRIRSGLAGGGYGLADGTSMAGPHVAGVVTLLWSAEPELIGEIQATEALLCESATPKPVDNTCQTGDNSPDPLGLEMIQTGNACACGGVTGVPNNVYGCGFIDAAAAIRAVQGQ
jgi:subtilisin family serine protease